MAKKKRSSFKGKVTHNAHKQQSQASSYGHLKLPKGVQVFKEEPNSKASLDFLPYLVTDKVHIDRDEEYGVAVPGELWYKKPYDLHRNIGPNNLSEPCPAGIGKKCPICEARAQALKDGADWSDDEVRALKPSRRNLYVVMPKKNKNFKDEPHVWDISQYLFQNQLNEELDEDEAYGAFPDLEEGLTLRIRFSEEVIGKNKFAETSRIDFREREKPYSEDILAKVPNLDDIIVYKTYKELQDLFNGADVEDTDEVIDDDGYGDEDDEPKSTRKAPAKKAPASKKKAKPVVDDDDDDDDFDEDEPEEEDFEDEEEDLAEKLMAEARKPKKIARGKKAPAPVVDDDDDEPEEDDEEVDMDEDVNDEVETDGMVECIACEGSGKNSKGKKCPICKGTGEVPGDEEEDEEPDDEEEEEDEEPAKPVRRKAPAKPAGKEPAKEKAPAKKAPASKKKKTTADGECPHGHTFGVDCEEYDECDECEKWEECIDAQEA